MAAAFLPWEEWLGRLFHKAHVVIRRWMFHGQRNYVLAESQNWSVTDGTVHEIHWDSSLPREEIIYSYQTKEGYRSGAYWRWFEPENAHEVRIDDSIRLRYDPRDSERSVLVGTIDHLWI